MGRLLLMGGGGAYIIHTKTLMKLNQMEVRAERVGGVRGQEVMEVLS